MKTDVWGKHLWYSIHLIALAYPEKPTNEEKRHYQAFFENLHEVLPCYKCSINYLKHLNEIPITTKVLSNTDNLFRWTVDIHNLVNVELGKEQWKYDEAIEYYRNFDSTKHASNKNVVKFNTTILFLLTIILTLLFLFLSDRAKLKK